MMKHTKLHTFLKEESVSTTIQLDKLFCVTSPH
jgi:hypothetical protein